MLKLWYYLRNFYKNRIEILFCKFLSGIQPYKKYRDKTFPLKDSEVLSKKNKGSPSAAFCMKITANIWKKQLSKPIERLSICNRIFCKRVRSINFLSKEFLKEPSTTFCDKLFTFYNWSKLGTNFLLGCTIFVDKFTFSTNMLLTKHQIYTVFEIKIRNTTFSIGSIRVNWKRSWYLL